MLNKDQQQDVDRGSTAIQVGRNFNLTMTGLSYADARNIAEDVYKENAQKLAGVAEEIARARAEEITNAFLSKMQTENPSGLDKFSDPDFQYAIFTVQKAYARSGERNLGELLIDLLVDRSKRGQRDILQIVLNESLITAEKLTEHQIAALSIIFVFKYTINNKINNDFTLSEYFDSYVEPLISKLIKNISCYQHLEFCGCGAIGLGQSTLENILVQNYKALFLNGFDAIEIVNRQVSIGRDSRFFMACLNNKNKVQVSAINDDVLNKLFDVNMIVDEDRVKIRSLFDAQKMNETEVKNKCIRLRPYMANMFEIWQESAMKNFTLTSVGIAIGHANIRRLIGEFGDLSIWIN